MSTKDLLLCLSVLAISTIAVYMAETQQENPAIGKIASLDYEAR